jgi:hypothetical protein
MSKKILATFGDSWPEGAGIGSGRRYGETLAELMQVDEFCNYGSGGASNEDLLYQFQTFVSQHHDDLGNTTAIFFLTNPARTAHFPRFFSWANADTKLKELYLHFHEPGHEVVRSSTGVLAWESGTFIFRAGYSITLGCPGLILTESGPKDRKPQPTGLDSLNTTVNIWSIPKTILTLVQMAHIPINWGMT